MSTSFRLSIGVAAVIAVILGGAYLLGPPAPGVGGGPSSSPSPTVSPTPSPSPSASPSAALPPIDTSTWTAYTSSQYGFNVGHPADWDVVPATRTWTFEADGRDFLTPAADAFIAPGQVIRVSVWTIPFEPGLTPGTTEDLEAWVEAYCQKTDITSCAGIRDRGEPLCVEVRDCHPGLLVPFSTEVQAFFMATTSSGDAMIVVSVWRPENDPQVRPYGGSKRLLEAFLSTMNVFPAP